MPCLVDAEFGNPPRSHQRCSRYCHGFEYLALLSSSQLGWHVLFWRLRRRHPPPLPVVLVQLDSYKGLRSYHPTIEGVIPVCPCTSSVRMRNVSYVRTQLPLDLAKASTAHKAQGRSLDAVAPRKMFCRAWRMWESAGQIFLIDLIFSELIY